MKRKHSSLTAGICRNSLEHSCKFARLTCWLLVCSLNMSCPCLKHKRKKERKKKKQKRTHSRNLQEFAGTFMQVCSFNLLVTGLVSKHVVFMFETQKKQRNKRKRKHSTPTAGTCRNSQEHSCRFARLTCWLLVCSLNTSCSFLKHKSNKNGRETQIYCTYSTNLQEHSCWYVR